MDKMVILVCFFKCIVVGVRNSSSIARHHSIRHHDSVLVVQNAYTLVPPQSEDCLIWVPCCLLIDLACHDQGKQTNKMFSLDFDSKYIIARGLHANCIT